MSSKRQQKKRQCLGKTQYVDKESAQSAARSLMQKGVTLSVHTYRCKYCSHYHVGRRRLR